VDDLVGGVLLGAPAGAGRAHLGAEEPHALHVGPLPRHVRLAHVDHALQTEPRAHRGGGHAVLAGAGLGDDASLAHAHRQQHLAEAVVQLVGAGVQQVLALQPDLRVAAQLDLQAAGPLQRGGAAGVVAQQQVQFGQERLVPRGLGVGRRQLLQRGHEGLGHVLAAEPAEAAVTDEARINGHGPPPGCARC
jgi:hypothetical protein